MTRRISRRALGVALAACAAACSIHFGGTRVEDADEPADLVIRGASVIDPYAKIDAQSIAVRDGVIVRLGSDDAIRSLYGSKTRVIDAGGGAVVAGLQDAHGHLFGLGESLESVDLRGVASIAELASRIEAFAAAHPSGWIHGRGWDQNLWPGAQFPTRWDVDAATGGRPAVLARVDGHALLVNSAALEIAGVGAATKDPDGGRILHNDRGDATGVLIDNAEALVTRVIPPWSAADLRRFALAAQGACLAAGLTAVHDAGETADQQEALRALDREGLLQMRVYGMAAPAAMPERPEFGNRYTLRAVKAYADGALGSRGAALLDVYEDDRTQRGLLLTPPDELLSIASRCLDRGLQLCVHAIGDRGNRVVLDTFEKAFAAQPSKAASARWRIEHCQVVAEPDFIRFKKLGVVASMQPTHATSDGPWAPLRLGAARMRGAYAWKRFLDLGVPLAFGSDFPVESHDPRLGLFAAMTLRAPDHPTAPAFGPGPVLSRAEALAAFTTGAAYASFREGDLGHVRVGNAADLTIFDRDPVAEPAGPDNLKARVLWTVVGGDVVYAPKAERTR